MNKLEKLIAKLCPNGVEYKPLGELLDYEQPTKYIVHSTEYDDSYATPVLTAGQTFILGYTDEEDGHYPASKKTPVIIFDDFTTATQWVDFEFKVKSSAMKILTLTKTGLANIRYVYYAIQCIKYVPGEHSRHWIEKYSKFEIPLPPLPVQEEIVRMLDDMTGLIGELEQELAARKQQYEWYRDKLLKMTNGGGYGEITIGDVLKVLRGKRLTKSMLSNDDVYPVYHGGLEPLGMYGQANRDADTVMIINVGASAGTVGYCDRKFWSSDGCYCLSKDDTVLPRFLYYALREKEPLLRSRVRIAGIPTLDAGVLMDVQINLPSLAEQKKIVARLDAFDKLCNSMTEGLPGEIAARKQQYEYYRDKLLTFKKAG